MPLMRLTPDWKSGYYWLAILAYVVCWSVGLAIINPIDAHTRFIMWLVYLPLFFWLVNLARDAQLEADWELPKTPRIPVK